MTLTLFTLILGYAIRCTPVLVRMSEGPISVVPGIGPLIMSGAQLAVVLSRTNPDMR